MQCVQKTILLALDQSAKKATEALSMKLAEAAEREKEVLEDLAESEKLNATQEADLSAAKAQIIDFQQRLDVESAVAAETITGLREQGGKLDREKNDLILSRESAKSEVAKIQLQLERADLAVSKSEENVLELKKQVATLIQSLTETEKGNAVAESHSQHLSDQMFKLDERLKNADEKIGELESERANLSNRLCAAESSRRKAEGSGEQMELRIAESAGANDQLRKELEIVRKEAAATTKLTGTGNSVESS
jgi:chromosome segregation ATPase